MDCTKKQPACNGLLSGKGKNRELQGRRFLHGSEKFFHLRKLFRHRGVLRDAIAATE